MARSPEGEYELVLGNKQLLSLFFLVVVLFAVFFSLGYMVGKAVAPTPTMAAQPQPSPAGSESNISPLPPPENSPAKQGSALDEPAPVVTETEPAHTEAVSARAAAPPIPAPRSPLAAPVASETTAAKTDLAAEPQLTGAVLGRELHLQIAALHVREDADALIEGLQKKGYKAVLDTQARDGWYRILMGPFPNERAAQAVKAALEKDGYKSMLRRP
jgi:septal ring-binding cell division protein DamX